MKGNKQRTQEPTAANQTSSRSHAVLQVAVKQQSRCRDVLQEVRFARLFMIDLAGSERAAQVCVSMSEMMLVWQLCRCTLYLVLKRVHSLLSATLSDTLHIYILKITSVSGHDCTLGSQCCACEVKTVIGTDGKYFYLYFQVIWPHISTPLHLFDSYSQQSPYKLRYYIQAI